MGLGNGPLPDLFALIQLNLGIPAIAIRAPQCVIQGMLAFENSTPFVVINSHQTPTWQRFTLAHLLGHWALNHGEMVDGRTTLSESSTGLERDASQFASEFLMPAAAIDEWYREQVSNADREIQLRDILALATIFGVEDKVAILRLVETGKISSESAASFSEAIIRGEHLRLRMFREFHDGVELLHVGAPDLVVPIEMYILLAIAFKGDRVSREEVELRLGHSIDDMEMFGEMPPEQDIENNDLEVDKLRKLMHA
jgi:Zn-dependent peptidase ImmA (M78 family)